MATLLLAFAAFLVGSFPSALVLTYLATGHDIRQHGSGNVGASNAASKAGPAVGIAVGILDLLKGLLPVLAGRWIGLGHTELALVGLAAVLGHDFSIFLRFRGGKGISTSAGVALGLMPLVGLAAMLTWLLVSVISRYASAASLVALAAAPIYMALAGAPAIYVWLTIALGLLGTAKHRENIILLARGTERRFGSQE